MIVIVCNGHPIKIDPSLTVAQLLNQQGYTGAGIAVALNQLVLPHTQWESTLTDGDVLEIVTAVQGG